MNRFQLILTALLIINVTPILGQSEMSNTMNYYDSLGYVAANLSQLAWLQGHWVGEVFGGPAEEVWTPPLAGSMMCVFKHVIDGKVNFYEILTISEEKGSLILRLKHFDNKLKGWEEKDVTRDFRLVKIENDIAYFDGLTFKKLDDEKMNLLVMINRDGTEEELIFEYRRSSPSKSK